MKGALGKKMDIRDVSEGNVPERTDAEEQDFFGNLPGLSGARKRSSESGKAPAAKAQNSFEEEGASRIVRQRKPSDGLLRGKGLDRKPESCMYLN